jgi:hypothetical protein
MQGEPRHVVDLIFCLPPTRRYRTQCFRQGNFPLCEAQSAAATSPQAWLTVGFGPNIPHTAGMACGAALSSELVGVEH